MTASIDDRVRRLEDLEAVRGMMYRYHQICDGWNEEGTHKDPEAIADLFTDDGIWDIPTPATERERTPAIGRAAIAGRMRELQGILWIIHFVVSPIVQLDGDNARGEFKAVVRAQVTESSVAAWWLGIYRVEAIRTPDGWRFRSVAWESLSMTSEQPPAVA